MPLESKIGSSIDRLLTVAGRRVFDATQVKNHAEHINAANCSGLVCEVHGINA